MPPHTPSIGPVVSQTSIGSCENAKAGGENGGGEEPKERQWSIKKRAIGEMGSPSGRRGVGEWENGQGGEEARDETERWRRRASSSDANSGNSGKGGRNSEEAGRKNSGTEGELSMYVIQKKGQSLNGRVTKVSRAYSFDKSDWTKLLDVVVDKCRCLDLTPACGIEVNASPVTSYDNELTRTQSGTSIIDDAFQREREDAREGVRQQIAQLREIGSKSGGVLSYDEDFDSDDEEDFRPARRTSSCFVMHNKGTVRGIFRDDAPTKDRVAQEGKEETTTSSSISSSN
jgi:hypothetical protein